MRSNNWQTHRTVPSFAGESTDSIADGVEERILLFGGTFEPPHIGHLMMAQLALEQCEIDAVWFLPSPAPPHKLHHDVRSVSWRTKMVEALISDGPKMKVVPIEERLPRPSYTVDTIRACQAWYPNKTFQFLLGSDSLADLPTWRGAEELSERIQFVVAVRRGFPFYETLTDTQTRLPSLKAIPIEMPILDVSSTWIRHRLQHGQPVCGLIPDKVLEIWYKAENTTSQGFDHGK